MTDSLTVGDEWPQEALEAFATMPIGSLADYFFTMLDIVPEG